MHGGKAPKRAFFTFSNDFCFPSRCTLLSTWKRHISYWVSADSYAQRLTSSILFAPLLCLGIPFPSFHILLSPCTILVAQSYRRGNVIFRIECLRTPIFRGLSPPFSLSLFSSAEISGWFSGDPLPIVSPSPVSLHHSRCTLLSTWKRHISKFIYIDIYLFLVWWPNPCMCTGITC